MHKGTFQSSRRERPSRAPKVPLANGYTKGGQSVRLPCEVVLASHMSASFKTSAGCQMALIIPPVGYKESGKA
jgi:hypothetical protein